MKEQSKTETVENLEDKKGHIASIIQKYLENQPVIILGSGSTIPYGLPTMSQLACNIKNNITSNSSNWKKFIEELDKTKDLEITLQNVQLSKDLIEKIVVGTWKYINEKDLTFYQSLLKDISPFPLSRLFAKLLQSHPKHIKVVTTNYDRVAEYASDLASAYSNTRFIGRYFLNFSHGDNHNHQNQNKIDIWKVHGSLDWFSNRQEILFSSPLTKEIPHDSIPLIVTPGIVKYEKTHDEPFRTIMKEADTALMNASCYLCIGYGFNDKHIQPNLIRELKQKGKPIVTITKELSDIGSHILLNNGVKSLILEKNTTENKTLVRYLENSQYKNDVLDGDYWKLDNFLNLWF